MEEKTVTDTLVDFAEGVTGSGELHPRAEPEPQRSPNAQYSFLKLVVEIL